MSKLSLVIGLLFIGVAGAAVVLVLFIYVLSKTGVALSVPNGIMGLAGYGWVYPFGIGVGILLIRSLVLIGIDTSKFVRSADEK